MLERLWKKTLRRKGLSLWSVPALFLWLVSLVYRLVVFVRTRTAKADVEVSVPVICVGNITVGGTGKTPMVEFLARYLLDEGHRVGIVSSGWGRRSEETILEPGYRVQNLEADVTGDEVMLLARLLPEAVFSVDRVKAEAARRLADTGEVDLIIVDDGFQHHRLRRDLDLVTYDGAVTKKFLRAFPFGLLREPIAALKRADVVKITRANFARDLGVLQRRVIKLSPKAEHYCAQFVATEIVNDEGRRNVKYLEDKSVLLFAGIGNFKPLRKQVTALCADLDCAMELSDHQVYDEDILAEIKQEADRCESDVLLTTFKDWVKLPDFAFGRELYYLGQSIDLDPGEEKLISYLQERLDLRKRES